MKTIFYSKDYQFDLTDNEFVSVMDKLNHTKKVFIPRLNVFLSDMFIWAGEKPDNKIKLHDGTYAIWSKGRYVDANNPDITLSLSYYPELTKGITENKLINKPTL